MARGERGDGPVGGEDYEVMKERLDEHFEKMQKLLERELEESRSEE